MKKVFIKDIKERDRVKDVFLVARKDMGISKAGKPYLNLRFMDSSGAIDARAWDNAEAMARGFETGDIVKARGYALSYRGVIQLNIAAIEKIPEGESSPADFLPSSRLKPEEMIKDLDKVIATLTDPSVKALLEGIFQDQDIRKRFQIAPAAKAMHHAFIGGLIEHVLSICTVVDFVAKHYKKDLEINRDILMAGAILHDIGKIYELSYESSFDYTDEGKLIGHITMGVELVNKTAASIPGFPEHIRMAINHLILSHHGLLEYGSPKRPKMAEAILLAFLDDMDAKMAALRVMTEDCEEGANWTPYQRMFERPIYTGLSGTIGDKGEAVTQEQEHKQEKAKPIPDLGALGDLGLFKGEG
ncbi:MAG: 3'-5' exoribonuclease YhaM family protein [Thermodesulfobacteriota bacterium]